MGRLAFPSNGSICTSCGKPVTYRADMDPNASGVEFGKYRRVCKKCKKWVHYQCFVPAEKLCFSCSGPSLFAMKEAAKDLGFDSEDQTNSALLVMSAFTVGPDENKLAEFTGLPLEFIQERAKRMRESKIWTADGRIILDEGTDMDDARQAEIVVILHAMCAEGEVICSQSSEEP